MVRLGVIGAGRRGAGLIRLIHALDPDVRLACVADHTPDQARDRLTRLEVDTRETRFVPSVEALVEQADQLDALIIAANCDQHTPLACAVASTGLPLLLEKPVAIDFDQWARLREAWQGMEHRVVVSFPLRFTPLYEAARQVVRSGRLGVVNQVQAVNNVSYGGTYFGSWYRDYHRVGGLWLQKATHDLDYITDLVGTRPWRIAAMATQLVYGGDMPEGLQCLHCDLTATCPESPSNLVRRGDDGGMSMDTRLAEQSPRNHWCAFGSEVRNQDAGSALVTYANGVVASYSQNFVARRQAHRRGANILGYRASAEFDWPTNRLRVIDHHDHRVDEVEVKATGGHGGGDSRLMRHFLEVIRDQAPSRADLHDGLLSAAMCLAARQAAAQGSVETIPAGEQPADDVASRLARCEPV